MSWFGGRQRRIARAVAAKQRRHAEADERTARADADAAAALARWRARDAQRRADKAAQSELDRHRAATDDAVVAADELDELARQADHDDDHGLTAAGRMLRQMRAEQVAHVPAVDRSRWLPPGATTPPAGQLHPALRKRPR